VKPASRRPARQPARWPVVVTRRFERALDAMLDHHAALQHLHPDAGAKALRLIELVQNDLAPLLAEQPDIGRPAQLHLLHNPAESAWIARLAPLSARRRLQAREWLLDDFWILYYRSADAVYLVSARHEREAQYR
jgi:hypothetical protein